MTKIILIAICTLFFLLETKNLLAIEIFPKPKIANLRSSPLYYINNIKTHLSHDLSWIISKILTSYPREEIPSRQAINLEINLDIDEKYLKKYPDLINPGSYVITQNKNIIIQAKGDAGIRNALITIYSLMNSKKLIPQIEIIDWPDHSLRALYIVASQNKYEILKHLVDLATLRKYNYIILEIGSGVHLDSISNFVKKNSLSKKNFKKLVLYIKKRGIKVIPSISLLTHQKKFLGDKFPQYMYNTETYDPRNKELINTVVYPYINELIDLIEPRAILIGHDEVAGLTKRSKRVYLKKNENPLPSPLFISHILKIYTYLQKKDIETWIWGDMFLSPSKFPSMLKKHLHGINDYQEILDKIPNDIVICDWHYFDNQTDFPSSIELSKNGNSVIGVTWHKEKTINNFSLYHKEKVNSSIGMMATTWFYVSKRDFNMLNKVINTSSEAYWNAN